MAKGTRFLFTAALVAAISINLFPVSAEAQAPAPAAAPQVDLAVHVFADGKLLKELRFRKADLLDVKAGSSDHPGVVRYTEEEIEALDQLPALEAAWTQYMGTTMDCIQSPDTEGLAALKARIEWIRDTVLTQADPAKRPAPYAGKEDWEIDVEVEGLRDKVFEMESATPQAWHCQPFYVQVADAVAARVTTLFPGGLPPEIAEDCEAAKARSTSINYVYPEDTLLDTAACATGGAMARFVLGTASEAPIGFRPVEVKEGAFQESDVSDFRDGTTVMVRTPAGEVQGNALSTSTADQLFVDGAASPVSALQVENGQAYAFVADSNWSGSVTFGFGGLPQGLALGGRALTLNDSDGNLNYRGYGAQAGIGYNPTDWFSVHGLFGAFSAESEVETANEHKGTSNWSPAISVAGVFSFQPIWRLVLDAGVGVDYLDYGWAFTPRAGLGVQTEIGRFTFHTTYNVVLEPLNGSDDNTRSTVREPLPGEVTDNPWGFDLSYWW